MKHNFLLGYLKLKVLIYCKENVQISLYTLKVCKSKEIKLNMLDLLWMDGVVVKGLAR